MRKTDSNIILPNIDFFKPNLQATKYSDKTANDAVECCY